MGGPERLARQAAKGRLNARERVARLCDEGTFKEIGALGEGGLDG
jgi:propionyl-CoA carboxylase beta chain